MTAHFIGTLLAYCFCLWVSWKLITGVNPLLVILGVLWFLGTLKVIFGDVVNLFTVSFHWVSVLIHNVANIFTAMV